MGSLGKIRVLASRAERKTRGYLRGLSPPTSRQHSAKNGSRWILKRVLAVLARVPRRLWKTRIFRRGWYLFAKTAKTLFSSFFLLIYTCFIGFLRLGVLAKALCQNSAKTKPKLFFAEFCLKPKLSFGKRCADPNRGPSTAFGLAILKDDPLVLRKLSKHTIERFRFHRKELSLDLAKRQTVFASLLYILQDFQNKPPMHGVATVSSN